MVHPERNMLRSLAKEHYSVAKTEHWPTSGKHILAQYDDNSIVVYQAYNRTIAAHAVQHQRFTGCPAFDTRRMTWIKTNFLWMMFRCGWAQKDTNQERVLAIWLTPSAFESYLERARCLGGKEQALTRGLVRLQWDPDHTPSGAKHPSRRAVQLGLKNIASFVDGTDILQIQDITDFVHSQRQALASHGGEAALVVPRERVYVPSSKAAIDAVGLDSLTKESTINPRMQGAKNYG